MFKFKFNNSDEENNDVQEIKQIQWFDAKEVKPCATTIEEDANIKTFECDSVKLKYLSSDDVLVNLINSEDSSTASSVLKAETNHSDLVAGEYEGGLKIWECTMDLINYLKNESVFFLNKKVLDLGCGSGLLGIYALLNGSLVVDFQDYNNEVLEHTTIPNVQINSKLDNCKFYSGDWKSFTEIVTKKYDIILTSETIYNPENYRKLCDLFCGLLEPDGVIYLAAKTYYFGVGGGTRQFETLLQNDFSSKICWTNTDGVQREIIKITRK